MAQTPSSKTTLHNNAAKDDVVGKHGDFTFTIADLLHNDPGHHKIDPTTQFYFGDSPDPSDQVRYLLNHGIVDNFDGTYTITQFAQDIDYHVEIKGTWSEAHVDVIRPAHEGAAYFADGFDFYTSNPVSGEVDLGSVGNGYTNLNGHKASDIVHSGVDGVTSSAGSGYWLDTHGLDVSRVFTDGTPAIAGGKSAELDFDIAIQNFVAADGSHHATTLDPHAAFEFKVDGHVVAKVTAAELHASVPDGTMEHFQVEFGYDPHHVGNDHVLEMVDLSKPAAAGFALDIHDWIA
jgi:hypothetical protein